MKNHFLISDSEKSRILSLHESHKDYHGTSLLNENEEVEVNKIKPTGEQYCKSGGMQNNLLSKIKSLGDEAKAKLKEVYVKIKDKSVRELLGLLKEVNKARKSSKNLNESVGAVMIAGVSIPGGIFIAIGALIVILIIVTILGKGKGGCAKNPFSRL